MPTQKLTLEEVIQNLTSNQCDSLDFLSTEVTLKKVSATFSQIHFNDDDFLRLAKAISVNASLNCFIYDTFNNTTEIYANREGFSALANALTVHPNLQRLDIHFSTNWRLEIELSRSLSNPRIQTLNLTFKSEDCLNILPKISEHLEANTSIEHISVKAELTRFVPIINGECLTAFTKSLQHKKLKSLIVKNFIIQDAQAFSDNLIHIESLHRLEFENCLSGENSIAITSILYKNPNIQILNLAKNYFNTDDFTQLTKSLASIKHLKSLTLKNLALDTQCLTSLIPTIISYKCLEELYLDLPYNDKQTNVTLIALVLKCVNTLKILDISMENMKVEDFTPLEKTLINPNECKLQKLILCDKATIFANDEIYNKLINILRSNTHLRSLVAGCIPENICKKINEIDLLENDKRRARRQFIAAAIKLWSIYFSPIDNQNLPSHFKNLPSDLILMMSLQENITVMKQEEQKQCSQLIFENFKMRTTLIQEKSYDPSQKNTKIVSWWSQNHRATHRQIFQTPVPELAQRIKSIRYF